jgi:REP element-mobilizing transposase RayT
MPFDADMPQLKKDCEQRMKEPPVFFNDEQANVILTRWQKVIPEVGWHLFAVAIMANHFHVVLAAPKLKSGKCSAAKLPDGIASVQSGSYGEYASTSRSCLTKEDFLRTLKARASFSLNKQYGKRTWWTESGSVRYCFDEESLNARIEYVMKQKNPLVIWHNPEEFNLHLQ